MPNKIIRWGGFPICRLLVLLALVVQANAQTMPSLEKAANALGGLDRIQKLKSIRLIGYGQYAYMFGGGNITGDPNAPMKFEAANTLERDYDLENNRYRQFERRNYLFPFADSRRPRLSSE